MTRSSSTLAVLSVLAASVLGVILARTIPSAVFPEIVFRRATILADSGDLPAEQMLASVTRPLEETAYGVPGVTLVRSTTTRGSTEIDVTFGEDADPQISYQMLSAAVAHTRAQLPSDTSIDAALLTTGTFPIVDLSLSSKVRSLPELTDIVNYDLVPSLHRIEGTYKVGVIGGKYREFVVRLDPARMLQHDLSPADVVTGLAKNNVISSAGRMNESHRMLLTVVTTDLHQADQIAAVPLTAAGGQPVRVSDVGAVELGIQEDYVRAASESGAAVLVGISRRPSGSTEQIAADARQILAEFRQRYPDVQFSVSYDQSDLVAESLKSVRDAIVLGLALSVLVVLAFTMSPLSAIVAAVVVPCTVAITFIAMKAAGLTFNMMTLGGLAAGIGLFIDDAIVMIEAIHRERAAGRETATAVAEALKRLQRPLIASTLTVIVVFGPLVFTSGVTGIFFRSLAATLGGGLAISLILAIYFTPAIELAIERFRGRAREAGRIYRGVQAAFLMAIRPVVRFPLLAIPGDRFNPRRVFRLQQYRHRLSAAARRRRIHPRLHHAAAEHDGRHHRAARLDSIDPQIDARSRCVQPPHRHAARIFSDRVEQRRHVGATEGGSQTRYRRGHRFHPRAHLEHGAGSAGRVLAGVAGSDRRSFGCSRADRSQGIRPRPENDRDDRAAGGESDAHDPRTGGCLRRNRREYPGAGGGRGQHFRRALRIERRRYSRRARFRNSGNCRYQRAVGRPTDRRARALP
jgi:multidrug efflux pump subunit AcrB